MRANELITPALCTHIKLALGQLDRVLPRQAPLALFGYYNPLHGYQDLPFEQALAAAGKLTGINCYLPELKFREFYRQGRITDADIQAVLEQDSGLQARDVLLHIQPEITKASVYRLTMLFDIEPALPSELAWQIEELNTLEKFQPDIPAEVRQRFLETDKGLATEKQLIADLWQLLLNKLALEQTYLHPENMLDLSLDQAEALLAQHKASQKKVSLKKATMHERMREAVIKTFARELQRLGTDMTLRTLMLDLCGVDILDFVRPQINRLCSSGLDEGLAPWQLPERSKAGIYAAWRAVAGLDINPFLQELPDWQSIIAELPDDPEEAIILQLIHLEIPQSQWDGYLRCLVLEMPGWPGMINWREQHPECAPLNDAKPTLADYLAIRLTLDRLWLNQICHDTWQIEASLSSLQNYVRKNSSEYMVRRHLYRRDLPEYLIQQAETLTLSVGMEQYDRSDWQNLADIIWTWQGSAMTNSRPVHTVYDSAWQLFRLCQHLGLNATRLSAVSINDLEKLLGLLRDFSTVKRSHIWLMAYERHYREDLLHTLCAQHSMRPWTTTKSVPFAQVIGTMDNRVEALRRHLETVNPAIETYGVAGFINRTGPQSPHSGSTSAVVRSDDTRNSLQSLIFRGVLGRLWHHSLRGNLLVSPLLMIIAMPIMLVDLILNGFLPSKRQALVEKLGQSLRVKSTATLTPKQTEPPLSDPDLIAQLLSLLTIIGLKNRFSPLIVFMGHAASTENNSHFATNRLATATIHQDGASAAATALLANQVEVRVQLARQGINIPADTWFIGAEHDTRSESVTWFNADDIPAYAQAAFNELQTNCQLACQQLAPEQRRQFTQTLANTPDNTVLQHVQAYSLDFSAPRPEVAYADATALVIGRRQLTQGLCLDRSVFLVSYEPTDDVKGNNLEKILLTVMPELLAINLAYYFATVDNQQFGSGNCVLHNVIGLLGVIEGASSDLRVGLPKQMTQNHAAMRLQVIIETTPTQLEKLFVHQPSLQQLIQNGWLNLIAQDPESGAIYFLGTDCQFSLWQPDRSGSSIFANAADAYSYSDQVRTSAGFKVAKRG